MTRILAATALLQVLTGLAAAGQANLGSLVADADAIVVAQISDTDYSRTSSDGPMTANAKVLNSVKGELKKDQSFRFTETAWVGPNYKAGEIRILFMESEGPRSWRVLSNLYAKTDFFIARDAIPYLNLNSLKSVLERLPPSGARAVVITRDMLK